MSGCLKWVEDKLGLGLVKGKSWRIEVGSSSGIDCVRKVARV